MRYFRSTAAVYESIRSQLDAAWGYPNAETKTLTAIPPVGELPADQQGRVYLAISAAYCEYVLPSQMLPELLASGAVEELTAAEYAAVFPPPDPPEPTAPASSPTLSPTAAPSGGGTLAPGVAPSLGGAIVR